MTTEQVWSTIEEIDQQLVVLISSAATIDQVKPLLNLRNKIILKYRPSPELNWKIQNKKVISFLKKQNWHVQWVSPDVPIEKLTGI